MPVSHDAEGTTWIVTLDSDAAVEPMRRAIERAGLTIQQILQPASVMIVHGTKAQAEKARRVDGVLAVEADLEFDVGPPDAPVS
jgi:3-oxoacyl-(acyl-carrier-protein) synthase